MTPVAMGAQAAKQTFAVHIVLQFLLFGCEPSKNIAASVLVLSVTEFGISPLVHPNDAYTSAAVLEKLYNLGMCLTFMTLLSVYLCIIMQL